MFKEGNESRQTLELLVLDIPPALIVLLNGHQMFAQLITQRLIKARSQQLQQLLDNRQEDRREVLELLL